MARLKLIQYLNDPTLLEQISEKEMIAWANEVPYAGLVQRLLAQKLAIENSKKTLAEKATTMAILSNANPNQVIKSIDDFKKLILHNAIPTTSSEESSDITSDSGDVGSSRRDEKEFTDEITLKEGTNEIGLDEASPVKESEESVPVLSQSKIHPSEEVESKPLTLEDLEDGDMSEFSEWLISLQSLNEAEVNEHTEIELEDKELASDALAQLLVSQGHYSQAIAMYEILMLKIPQKSSFFADQIQKLKSL